MPRNRAARRLLLVGAGLGIGYLGFALARVRRFGRQPFPRASRHPSVSVLKPLFGLEEELYENLCSFCEQDYPAYEVVFGARDPDDPALEIARRVVARFPARSRIAAGAAVPAWGNPKVANLAGMIGEARGEVVVVADADMRVGHDYLRALVAPFDGAQVGAVTCLYAATPRGGLAAMLGAMFINEQFAPSVLVAGALEPLRYCFGATIAIRRDVLDAIGGLAALASHVADDHEIGRLVRERGLDVVLSRYVVENVVAEPGLAALWSRELRWSRTIRSVRPLGHAFSFLTFGLPLAFAAALATGRVPARPALLGTAFALRIALQAAAAEAFELRRPASPLLVPLRDVLSVAVWICSFFGRSVRWRAHELRLDERGRIESGG